MPIHIHKNLNFIAYLFLLRGALNISGFLICVLRMAPFDKILNDIRLFLSHFKVIV